MKKLRILIAEDESIISMDIQNTLESLGYDVVAAVTSGEEAIEKTEELKPDLVLIDIILSGKIDGIDAVGQIIEKLDIPAIYLTAHTENGTFERARETGPYGYLVKPVRRNDFFTAIETALHRHELEKKLRENEKRYRVVVENTNEGLTIAQDGILKYANPGMLKITGFSMEESVSKAFTDFIHPDDRDMVRDKHQRRLKGEKVESKYNFKGIRKDGSVRRMEISSTLIEWEGNPATLNLLSDATDRINTEEALNKSNIFLQSIFDSIQDGISVLDIDLNIIRVNVWMEKMYRQAAPLSGKKCYDVYQGRQSPCPWCPTIPAIETGETQTKTVPYPSDENPTGWIDVSAYPLYDANSNIIGVIEHVKDITERKQAEDALKESENRYRMLIENANEAIFIAQDGFLKFPNPKCTEITGYSQEELTSKPFIEFIHPDDMEMVYEHHLKRLKGEQLEQVYVFRIINKKGDIKWVELNANLYEWEGKPATLNFMSDITERKQAEEQINTSLLEKETLLKEIHHRVKNNFQIITSLLRLQEPGLKNRELTSVLKSSENRIRAMALVHERLCQSDDLTRINFNEYIRTIIADLYQVDLCDPDRIELQVNAEKVQLGIDQAIPCGLIINELVSNSIKHAFPPELKRKGKLVISLKLKYNDIIELMIADNGIGIPKNNDIENVDSLGLKLVSLLSKGQLNGTFELDRKNGTKFTITFPNTA